MKRLLHCLLLLGLVGMLAACGPTRKSVFPPKVTVQQLVEQADGQWQLTLRIQNNSYAGMDFTVIDGQLKIADQVPLRVHLQFDRDIPALAGDTVQLDVLPTRAMTQALAAARVKGSAGALAYQLSGTATAKPEQENKPRDFDFNGTDWLSPVPGIAHTWR